MWTDKQFWRDSTWRAFRTFCQSLAGLLTVQQVSSNLNAPWFTLIYASAVAGLVSLLQSIDRERVAVAVSTPTTTTDAMLDYSESDPPTAPLPTPDGHDSSSNQAPMFGFIGTTHGHGESLR